MALKFAGQQVAIITDRIRKQMLQNIFNEASDSDTNNYYYIGYAKSTEWNATDTAPTPENKLREEKQFRYNLQSVKAIEGFSYVVPRFNWQSGSIYQPYDDNVSGHPSQSYYVLTEDNNVYLCVRQGRTTTGAAQASSDKPDHTDTSLPVENDGYVWKYLYTLTSNDQNRFTTANYMPVKYVDSAASTDPEYGQYVIQQAAKPGQIVGFNIISGGTGYTNEGSLVITINGDGAGAKARGIINTATNSIADVQIADSAGGYPMGINYNKATVTVSGGGSNATGANIKPIFAPKNGLGADPRDDLRSTALMMNIKPAGGVEVDGEDKFILGNSFRQVGLLKNIYDSANGSLFTAEAGSALMKAHFTSSPSGGDNEFAANVVITGDNTGAQAYVDYFLDSGNGKIWYHQDESTGFVDFGKENVVDSDGTQAIISSFDSPDFDAFTGELLYIDNRPTAIPRSADQTEDVKVVIQL